MKRIFLLLLMMTLLTSCTALASGEFDLTFTNRELSAAWDEKKAVTITGQGKTCRISGKGASLSGNMLTISCEGVYVFSGDFTDIQIVVAAGKKDKVQLVLNSAVITSPSSAVILIESADKVFLTAADGTQNQLCDGADRTEDSQALDAAVFSRADLCLNGTGELTIQGLYKHGIVSKDDLVITGLTLSVEAASTALDGKDCIKLSGAAVTAKAGSNGLRADNTEDADRGFIYIKDSSLTITVGTDGIQAETLLQADNATIAITTGEGSGEAPQSATDDFGGFGMFGGFMDFRGHGRSNSTAENTGSWKGIRAGKNIRLNSGTFTIDSQDDCIHSNGDLTINGGAFTLKSGDDGIHADNELFIAGGDIVISQSFEGVEASKLTISGGNIDITASDDGLNAAGGADGSASADRWGRGMFSNGVGEIVITGGYIHINAKGDGIDSNNTIHISGGVTLVSGSPSGANAAFDYDGEATVTGGVLIATGGSGMAQSFTAAENQGCMLFGLNGGPAGRNLAIVNAEGRIVASYTPVNNYSAVVITAPDIQVGSTYQVVIDAVINGADSHGFAADVNYTGGAVLGSLEMTTALQGGSGHSMGGVPGGGRRPGR
nr:carbohydrate-binding domain-containing protein [Clostridia bacterium]